MDKLTQGQESLKKTYTVECYQQSLTGSPEDIVAHIKAIAGFQKTTSEEYRRHFTQYLNTMKQTEFEVPSDDESFMKLLEKEGILEIQKEEYETEPGTIIVKTQTDSYVSGDIITVLQELHSITNDLRKSINEFLADIAYDVYLENEIPKIDFSTIKTKDAIACIESLQEYGMIDVIAGDIQKAIRDALNEADHINLAGAPSFGPNIEHATVQLLTVNTLGNTYYASDKKISEDTVRALQEMLEKDPEFLAKALVYARNEGLMKRVPTLGLAMLSTTENKEIFAKAFAKVIRTPDDLRTFVTDCRGENGVKIPGRTGLGRAPRKAAQVFLTDRMSEYQTVKYSGQANKKKNGKRPLSVADIVRLTHPKTEDEAASERLKWLTAKKRGKVEIQHNKQIAAFENLKRTQDEAEIIKFIEEGRLPYEVVVPAVSKITPAIGEALLKQAPYMNLLRSINFFERRGVFAKPENIKYAIEKLTNPEIVRKSMVLPFRFYDAWKALKTKHPELKEALVTALEISINNLPELPGRVAIAPDTSGSMGGYIVNGGARGWSGRDEKGTTCSEIAGLFTAALQKKCGEDTQILPFDTDIHHEFISRHDSVMSNTKKIGKLGGGGTAVGAPIEYLGQNGIVVDTYVSLTDNEDWAESRYWCGGSGFLNAWRKYREEVNPNAEAFLITLAPYGDRVTPEDEPGVHYIYGWNPQVLKYIAQSKQTPDAQIEAVRNIEL